MASTRINGILKASYRYNSQGQRVIKQLSNGLYTLYYYDLSGQLIAEANYNNNNSLIEQKSYVWINQKPIAMITTGNNPSTLNGSNINYIHFDYLNTPRKVSNQNQSIIWTWQSDAFGLSQANENPDGDGANTLLNLRFPGQYYDEETGLHYNYFRDYDPATGRYVESDPIGLAGGINTFAYVGGNPVNWVDPLGLVSSFFQKLVQAATTAVWLFGGGVDDGKTTKPPGPSRENMQKTEEANRSYRKKQKGHKERGSASPEDIYRLIPWYVLSKGTGGCDANGNCRDMRPSAANLSSSSPNENKKDKRLFCLLNPSAPNCKPDNKQCS